MFKKYFDIKEIIKKVSQGYFDEGGEQERYEEPDYNQWETEQVFQDREGREDEDGSTGNDDYTNEQWLKNFGEPGFYACPMGGNVEDYGPFSSIEEAMSVLQVNPGETVEKFQVTEQDGQLQVTDLNQFGNTAIW
jgi:hypothetical protein